MNLSFLKFAFRINVALFYIHASTSAFETASPSEVLRSVSGRIRGASNRTDKDFILGGLFAIHNAATGGGQCGIIRQEKGLERMEAMLYAIDIINEDDNLLSGLRLGYDIRDTCASENIGLDESLDLVVVNNQMRIESCQNSCFQRGNGTQEIEEALVTGVVGASNSGVSVPVAGLLRLFTTPQISYASSSALLNNRDRYGYFFRTTPPDTLQARAMVDLLRYFNWTYISTIYSKDSYGGPGIDEVHALAIEYNICIDLNEGISTSFSDEQFSELAEKVISSNAQIIIVFTTENDAQKLFQALQPIYTGNFTWIASDFWSRSSNILENYGSIVTGMIGLAPRAQFTPGFHNYFSNLTLDNNLRNPWFEEWYSAIENCSTNSTGTPCNRTQSAARQFQQGQRSPLVIDAVFAFAYALSGFLKDSCAQPVHWFRSNNTCFGQAKELSGMNLLEYVQRVNFTSPTGHDVTFDIEGNAPGSYDVVNFQLIHDQGKSSLVNIGIWTNFKPGIDPLQILSTSKVQFGLDSSGERAITETPESHCSLCPPGKFQRQVQSSCCGICDPCLGPYYSAGSSAINCSICEDGYWGNDPLIGSSGCIEVEESFLHFSHPYSIIIMIIAGLGLVAVAVTLILFIVHWNTTIVKASGREQMILLLIGVALSFVSAFFFVSPPESIICGFQRWCLWSCFSIMFGALLVKVVRVARIFLQPNTLKKLAFTEPQYQVLFTSAIIFVQWAILVISTSVNAPTVVRETRIDANMPNGFPQVVVTCSREHIGFIGISLGYQSLLVLLCTILGALSFKYPDNYNEAKHIALCSISISVIWIAFIITYFATENKEELQNIAISLAVVTTGYAVLLSTFGPRVHLVLLKSDRNPKTNGLNLNRDPTTGLNTQYVLELGQYNTEMPTTIDASPKKSKPSDGTITKI